MTVINHDSDWSANWQSVVFPSDHIRTYLRFLHSAQTSCGAHQAYYPVSTRSKVANA